MKSKITIRLVLYFSALLLFFALVVGIVFTISFSKRENQIYINEQTKKAENISSALSQLIYGEGREKRRQGGGNPFNSFIKAINTIVEGDVWIVDRDNNSILVGTEAEINYLEIKDKEKEIIEGVFKGKKVEAELISTGINSNTLIIATAIKDKAGNIVAALLLHSHISSINSILASSLAILFVAILLALVLGVILANILSRRFIKPINTIIGTTNALMAKDYNARTGIAQQDEIGNLALSIDSFAEKLLEAEKNSRELEQMRRDYISNISHELRTPLAVIKSTMEAICDGVVEEELINSYYEEVLKESNNLEIMINDLLELSRLQNPKYSIEKRPCNLLEIIEDSIKSAQVLARNKNIKIHRNIQTDSLLIEGDYSRLRQMLMIVFSNAVNHGVEGGNIYIELKDNRLNICDDGIGISQRDRERIFERFYKADGSGTGLGLSIAKEIADRHGINIEVEANEPIGTCFSFEIPNVE